MVKTGPNTGRPAYDQPQAARRGIEQATAELRAYFRGGDFNPEDPLPTESELRARFKLTAYTLRQALTALRQAGVITTVNGKGSYLAHPAPQAVITRDPADPYRDLTPIGARNDGLARADLLTATDFNIRAGDRTYVSTQRYRHVRTDRTVYYVRTLPLSAVYDIEPEPDPFGDRDALIDALTGHYGQLHTHTRYRVITHPDAELALELDLDPSTPALQHRRLTQTSRGRLLMIETEATEATTAEWEQV